MSVTPNSNEGEDDNTNRSENKNKTNSKSLSVQVGKKSPKSRAFIPDDDIVAKAKLESEEEETEKPTIIRKKRRTSHGRTNTSSSSDPPTEKEKEPKKSLVRRHARRIDDVSVHFTRNHKVPKQKQSVFIDKELKGLLTTDQLTLIEQQTLVIFNTRTFKEYARKLVQESYESKSKRIL